MKILLSILAACLMTFNAQANDMKHGPAVSDIWIRATPPGVTTSAMYMMIKNPTEKALRLTSVTSEVSDRIEIHNTIEKDGAMKMQQIDGIDVDAQNMAELKPHGKHIMFFDLKEALATDTKITIDLVFEDGTTITTEVPVLKQGASHDNHSDMKPKKHKDH